MNPAKEQQSTTAAGANGAPQSPGTLFTADLPAGELDRILQRIEENIEIRRVTRGDPPHGPSEIQRLSQSISASIRDTEVLVQKLEASHGTAPMYQVTGRGARSLVKRLLNLPIRVFGRRQRGFNRELITLLSQAPRSQTALRELVERLRVEIEESNNSIRAVGEKTEQTERWLKSVAERGTGAENWLRAVQLELRDIAFELREVKADRARDTWIAKIPSPADFATKVAAMGDEVKVNIGTSHKLNDQYINVDFRELEGVDAVADARALPFTEGSLAEISSEHLIEHFREYELRNRVLPYWRSLLRDGGRLRIVCPNWEAILRMFHAGTIPLERLKVLTFGGQDYEGDDHFAMYTPATLTALLEQCGFSPVEVLVADRDNAGCPEMELLAHKSKQHIGS